jgi:hypothetical protein
VGREESKRKRIIIFKVLSFLFFRKESFIIFGYKRITGVYIAAL